MMQLPIAVLAGGLATRMRPRTEKIPKSLLEVAGRPFAEHQLDLLSASGARRVVFCVGYLGDQIRDTLGDGSRWGLELRYVFDGPTLRGTGGALQQALPELGDRFMVLYGDSYLRCDYCAIERAFLASDADGLMTVFANNNQWDSSNVVYSCGRIVAYDKHKRLRTMRHIDYGLGALHARALTAMPCDRPFDLAEAYQRLVKAGRLAGYETFERFYEIGSPSGLEETRNLLEGRS